MTLVRIIDRLVIVMESLATQDGRALRLTVGMTTLTFALLAVLGFTIALARMGAVS